MIRANERGLEIVKRWSSILELCKVKQRELSEIRMLCEDKLNISAISYDGLPKSRKIHSPVENAVIYTLEAYQRRMEEISKEIEALLIEKARLDAIIQLLPQREFRLLKMRYLDKRSWHYIAIMLGYSERQCHRIHTGALDLIAKKSS